MRTLRFTSGTNHPNSEDDTRNESSKRNDSLQDQAELVKRLPKDFPIDRFEAMNTKQQLNALKFSGLNDKEQWVLLNASAPLCDLKESSQTHDDAETKAYVAKVIAPHASKPEQNSQESVHTTNQKSSNSTSLQNGAARRKLDLRQEEYEARFFEKTADRNPIQAQESKTTRFHAAKQALELRTADHDSDQDSNKKASLWDQFTSFLRDLFSPEEEKEAAKDTPQIVTIETVPPTETPKLTPSPKATATPSLTTTPGLTKREQMASSIVEFAKQQVLAEAKYSSTGRFGKDGFDCSGLVIAVCENSRSKLPFDNVRIKRTCKYGMARSFLANNEYGEKLYAYQEDIAIPKLQPGDLVFYADPSNLERDLHVTIATGEMVYDLKADRYWPQVIEASGYSNTVTDQFPAFNNTNLNGYYYRSHSQQIVTYVIRPNYDWEEHE